MKKILKNLSKPAGMKRAVTVIISVIFFVVLSAVLIPERTNAAATVVFISVIYLLLVVLAGLIIDYAFLKKYELDVEKHFSQDISAGLYNNLAVPFAVCDEHGMIQLSNKAFNRMLDETDIKTKKLSGVAGFGIESLMLSADDGITAEVGEKIYRVKGYIASPDAPNLFVTVWYDRTELEKITAAMHDDDALFAYIVIDNIEEIRQIEQENMGSAAADVDKLLIEWAKSFEGIIKNYESNKYILIYKSKYLQEFIDNKFEILEKVRSIRVGLNLMSVTISIGTSDIGSTFAERERNAEAAIEIALGRGGDQAVIKTDSNFLFFGGIVKGTQKRSTVKSRTVAQALMSLITKSSNVLVMGHRNPDFDSIGSCVGIARLVMYCGAKCNIIADTNDKNLEKCFKMLSSLPAYDNIFVSAADAQDLIKANTLLIICDVNNPSQFEGPDIAKNAARVAYIDHHRITTEFEKPPVLYYIEPSASSACELVSEILENSMPVGTVTVQEANLMYAGIMLDTKRFAINTGTRTFTSANYLRSVGANPTATQELFKTSLEEMLRENRFQKQVKIYREKVVISVNTETDNTAADGIAAAKFADKLLSIDGIEASFVMLTIGSDVRISARSTGTINVQIILERLRGGGHYNAAATMLSDIPLENAMKLLKESIDEYFDVDMKENKNGENK